MFKSTLVFCALMGFLAACAPPVTPRPVIQKETVVVGSIIEKQVVVAPTAEPTTTPLAIKSPRSTDTIIFGQRSEPDTLHPLEGSMLARDIILSALFANCTRENDRMEWVAEMCESVPTLENGGAGWVGEGDERHLEVTFKLKAGWKWHDGVPVTAADYTFAWRVALDPAIQVGQREEWERIQEMAAADERTVVAKYHSAKSLSAAVKASVGTPLEADYARLKKETPNGPLVRVFYYALGSPLPEHILGKIPPAEQERSPFAHAPVGNGAYKFVAWKPAQQIELEANEQFLLGAPTIKHLLVKFTPILTDPMSAVENGALDGATEDSWGVVSMSDADSQALTQAGYRIYRVPTFTWEHVDLNGTAFPFDDVRVRRALAYATDKGSIVAKSGGSKAVWNSFLPETHWAYEDASVVKYEYSAGKAKELLRQAGWDCSGSPCTRKAPDGRTQILEFTLVTTDRADRVQVAQKLQAQWKQAGFGVNLRFLYGRGLFAPAREGGPLESRNFQAAMYTWITGEEPRLTGLYDCGSIPPGNGQAAGQNYAGWCNRQVDAKILQLSNDPTVVTNREKFKSTLAEISRAWTEDVPVIPLYGGVTVMAARSDIAGVAPAPGMKGDDFYNAWRWEIVR